MFVRRDVERWFEAVVAWAGPSSGACGYFLLLMFQAQTMGQQWSAANRSQNAVYKMNEISN